MKLIEFMAKYPTDESCKQELCKIKERKGIVYPVCGGIHHYWKGDKEYSLEGAVVMQRLTRCFLVFPLWEITAWL